MTAALIVNPNSGRRSGRGLALAEAWRRIAGSRVALIERFGALEGLLRQFATEGVDTLFISSGDGTVQAIQTILAERGPFARLPRLALLPHGTTNLTANELGLKWKSLDQIASLATDASLPRPGVDLVRRPTLRIANPRDGRPRQGMFLGAAAIARASAFCQGKIHRAGLKGDLANFAVLAVGVGEAFVRRAARDDPERIVMPYPMAVRVDGQSFVHGDQLLLLATTLNRLILKSRPFWGRQSAAIRVTAIAYPPPSVVRWLVPILYGSEDRTLPESCKSTSAGCILVETAAPFLLDGEFFDGPVGEGLRIETGPDFTYIVG